MRNVYTLLILSIFLSTILAGCSKGPEKKPIEIDPNYSVNVVSVPSYWPREKLDYPKKDTVMKQTMIKAYRQYGRPDYLRRVYTADRTRIIRPNDLQEGVTLPGRIPEKTEWIYTKEDLILEFKFDEIIEHELDDRLEIICLYGDPNEIRPHKTQLGDLNIIYTYYGHGTFTFHEGKLLREDKFMQSHNQSDTGLLR